MKHIKIYEAFNDTEMAYATESPDVGQFETETTDFSPIDQGEGDYIVNFTNAEGEKTTIEIGHAISPEYTGSSMISSIDMVPDSSSDGKQYSVIGYYDEVPGSMGAYELKKVLIGEE